MLLGLLMASVLTQTDTTGADREFFETHVRPVLVQKCQGCHGPEKQKGDLRLDSKAAMLAGGKTGPAVVPGKPDESVLVEAINYGDLLQMPPKSKLPEKEIEALTRWVKSGAYFPEGAGAASVPTGKVSAFDLKARAEHWSFQPIRKVDPPQVKDTSWPLSPVDRFILAGLEAKGIAPGPEADRRTLLRRATYDLIGLPPTLDEINAFLEDRSPDAYEKVIERLLASPHYGERWGRHWLDLMRFAETSGHEFDYDIPHAWQYRDYVVRAMNLDIPYDQFLTEHVAGDLMPKPRRDPKTGFNESVIATGFYFLGEGTHSPVDVRDDEILRIDNQIDVIAKSFLGLTVSCARCHDHKFDAISTKDYYAMAGFLQSSRHQQAFIDDPGPRSKSIGDLNAIKTRIATLLGPTKGDATADRYHSAALVVLKRPPSLDPDDILFDDFEGDRYEKWTASGDAFGERPLRLPVPDYQGEVDAHGQGLVGSHNGRVPIDVRGRDALRGVLTSDEFRIQRNFLHALIGGGSHSGKTCVNILVDGQVVRSATGRDENKMSPAVFDLRPWRGKFARLQVVDDDAGGWGNISLDWVVFSDLESPPGSPERSVRAEAREHHLDEGLLTRWVQTLAQIGPATPAKDVTNRPILADFGGPDFGDWTTTGDAFGTGPTVAGDFVVLPSQIQSVPSGVAHSGLVAKGLYGVLRSPTLPLDRRYLHFRTWGQSGVINIVIDGFEKIRAPIYGGLTARVNSASPAWITMDVGMWKNHRGYIEFGDGATLDYSGGNTQIAPGDGFIAVDEVQFSDSPTPAPIEDLKPAPPSTREQVHAFAIENNLLPATPQELTSLTKTYMEIASTVPPPTLAPAILDGSPEDERVHLRGSARTLGDVVPRRFLEAISGPEPMAPSTGSGRLELAERILDPSCPLPARVMVNRLWKGHFGLGIVKTTDDFGRMGEMPSHPELLDWLASEFRDRGWSLKAMHREMVLSRTYRMTSALDPKADSLDPDNRLLHRMNPRRLEAEAVRDGMLFVSGRLDPRLGGPSIMPEITPFMEGRGRPGRSGPLDGEGRRSLYLNVRRNFLPPMLLAFDFPPPASTMGRRNVSNVPAQALVLLNDPFVIEQAARWAQKLLAEPDLSTVARIKHAYVQAFGRMASEEELRDAQAFLAGKDASAWSDLAHVLFNVKEFIFVP